MKRKYGPEDYQQGDELEEEGPIGDQHTIERLSETIADLSRANAELADAYTDVLTVKKELENKLLMHEVAIRDMLEAIAAGQDVNDPELLNPLRKALGDI